MRCLGTPTGSPPLPAASPGPHRQSGGLPGVRALPAICSLRPHGTGRGRRPVSKLGIQAHATDPPKSPIPRQNHPRSRGCRRRGGSTRKRGQCSSLSRTFYDLRAPYQLQRALTEPSTLPGPPTQPGRPLPGRLPPAIRPAKMARGHCGGHPQSGVTRPPGMSRGRVVNSHATPP